MDEQGPRSNAHRWFVREKSAENKLNMFNKGFPNQRNDPFPFLMLATVVSSLLIVVFVIGLAVSRYYTYYKRRQEQSKDLSYSVSRYWRRQYASTSFDSTSVSPAVKANPKDNESPHMMKSSFSWPAAIVDHQPQQQEHEEDLEESSSIFSSPTLSNSSTMEQLHQPATLTFALRWDHIKGSIFVRVINARDLFGHRRNQQTTLIDSYVRIALLSTSTDKTQESLQSMRTHIIKKNAQPIYDELFEFTYLQQPNLSLLFTILTYDTFTRDEILGQVEFPLHPTPNTLPPTETTFTKEITPRRKQLSNQPLGQMLVSLCYQPADSSISLVVLKASNLPRLGTTRLINPYFKIYMFYKGQRIVKKRSTIKRTTQSPVYNECFTFPIPDNDIQNVCFDIILFDYDRHMKNEPIGTFSIGNNLTEINSHWNDVCRRQISKQIAQWYQLKPFHIPN